MPFFPNFPLRPSVRRSTKNNEEIEKERSRLFSPEGFVSEEGEEKPALLKLPKDIDLAVTRDILENRLKSAYDALEQEDSDVVVREAADEIRAFQDTCEEEIDRVCALLQLNQDRDLTFEEATRRENLLIELRKSLAALEKDLREDLERRKSTLSEASNDYDELFSKVLNAISGAQKAADSRLESQLGEVCLAANELGADFFEHLAERNLVVILPDLPADSQMVIGKVNGSRVEYRQNEKYPNGAYALEDPTCSGKARYIAGLASIVHKIRVSHRGKDRPTTVKVSISPNSTLSDKDKRETVMMTLDYLKKNRIPVSNINEFDDLLSDRPPIQIIPDQPPAGLTCR